MFDFSILKNHPDLSDERNKKFRCKSNKETKSSLDISDFAALGANVYAYMKGFQKNYEKIKGVPNVAFKNKSINICKDCLENILTEKKKNKEKVNLKNDHH